MNTNERHGKKCYSVSQAQARSQVVCWGGAKQVISGLNQWCSQDNTCMYGRAHTARCRVCIKLRKPQKSCTQPTLV